MIPLYLTHTKVTTNIHLWALRLRYREGIIGVVLAHGDDDTGMSELRWDWSTEPWPRVEARAA